MAKSELTVENAPRNAVLLLKLSSVQRQRLFMLLCEDAEKELDPGEKAFSELEATQQVDRLLQLLMLYDQQTSGYIVVPLTLPVRTKQTKTNESRWEAFAEELQTVLNNMRVDGFNSIQPIKFEEHGFLVIGFKQPPPQVQFVPVGVVGGPGGGPGIGRPPGSAMSELEQQMIERKVQRLLQLVDARRVAASTDVLDRGAMDEIVQEEVKSLPAEAVRKVLVGLEDRMRAHEGAHTEKGDAAQCVHTHELRLLKEALEDKLRMQLC